MKRRFVLNNFTGGMVTVAEANAYMEIDPGAALGVGLSQVKTEFQSIQNFLPIFRGGLSKARGFALYAHVGTGIVTGIYRFLQSTGTNQLLISLGNTLYLANGTSYTAVYMGLASNVATHMTTALDQCIICDGQNYPIVYTGSGTRTLGGGPPIGARQTLFYKNRLWIFSSTSNQSFVYYSNPNSIDTGYASNFVQCDYNDGQKITALSAFYIAGLGQPVILVGKERSVGIITGDGASTPFTFQKISFDLGIPGFRQVAQYGQVIAYLTPQGVNTYDLGQHSINLASAMLSSNIRDQFTGLNSNTLANAIAWYDWVNERLCVAVASGSSPYPNLVWNYDTRNRGWYQQTGYNITAVFVDTNGSIFHGDEQGNIYLHSNSIDDYNGNPIIASCQTGYTDFFEPDLYKRITHASIQVRGNGNYNMGISTELNYGVNTGSSHTIQLQAAYAWGNGLWSNNANTYQWGMPGIKKQLFFPKNIFKSIAFGFNQSGAGQRVDLFELQLEVEYLDIY